MDGSGATDAAGPGVSVCIHIHVHTHTYQRQSVNGKRCPTCERFERFAGLVGATLEPSAYKATPRKGELPLGCKEPPQPNYRKQS